jgi:hypothetical protein
MRLKQGKLPTLCLLQKNTMPYFPLLLLLFFCGPVVAGQLSGDGFTGERFGMIRVVAPPSLWLLLDREFSGSNEFGGPVLDLKATTAIAGYLPSAHLSAFKRADASVTAEFVLQTSQQAVRQKGGQPGPVGRRTLNGKTTWFFEAELVQQERPARLYYVLLEGSEAYFALQTVVPEAVFADTKQRIDELLLKVSY